MAEDKELMVIQAKVEAGIKLSKDEKAYLKANNAEAKAAKSKMSFGERMKLACKAEHCQLMGDDDPDLFPIRDWISTGNALLNAQLSSYYDKGIPSGRVVQFNGDASVGKTYLALECLKSAQAMGYFGVLYDSEMANNDREALKARGVDTSKLLYIPIDSVENLKTSLLNIINEATPDDKLFVVIDSIGNLSTRKELEDSLEGSATKDMTRPAQLKALFRTCTIKAGVKNIPIIAINHQYACGTGKMIVSMADGIDKSIKDIEIGEEVQTLMGNKKVLNTMQYENASVYEIELENGEILEFTENHKFMVKNTHGFIWKEIYDLKENETILSI